jgi:hypothetical protein
MATQSDERAAWLSSNDPNEPRPLVGLYNTSAIHYPWADDVYLAFPSVYYRTGPDTTPVGTDGNDGLFEVELAVSRDSVNWSRYRRFDGHKPYVPLWDHKGPVAGRSAARGLLTYGRTGQNDGDRPTYLVSMDQGMIRQGDEIWQYFHALRNTHGKATELNGHFDKIFKDPPDRERETAWADSDKGGIYLARQRLDGFVSVDADESEMILTTRPIVCSGDTVRLNAIVADGGRMTVRLTDPDGRPLAGIVPGDSHRVAGDSVAHVVTWKSGGHLGGLSGQPVRLVFRMTQARLFSFEFVDKP